MNIFLRELKANRKALLIWCVCMILLIFSGMGKYTAYSGGGQSSNIFNDMPYSIKALLGFGSFDVTKMPGYFALLFLYIELAVSIHAVLLGAGIIAKEERDKTTEFLIVKPVSRTTIITAKLLAALFNVVILNLVSLVSSVFMVSYLNKGKDISGEIFVFMLSMFIVQLIFLSLGAVLAASLRKPKLSGSISVGILLTSFVFSKITDLTDRINVLNVFSPFKYFDYKNIVNEKGLDAVPVLFSLALIAVFSVFTYYCYRKRDLSI